MTIDEAISHAEEVAEHNDNLIRWGCINESVTHNCRECAAEQRQFAEWLTELKNLREENKVLTSERDRLIKEKGELLSKVSGGDVLRICQLEEQLKDWKEEYANLNKISYGFYKELKEAKLLLKSAINVLKVYRPCDDDICSECINHTRRSYATDCLRCYEDDYFEWKYLNTPELKKIIGE